ncbi:MAG TPA: hypothetical protein VD861_15450 [Pyrinomonadaceae bacterium]|nr:hypothetical protein [Pyrinomonadaceae bacterium]
MSRLKFLTAVLLLLTPAAAVCQEGAPATVAQEGCPRIEVMCPTEMLEQGTPMTVSAQVSGGDPNAQFTFNWSLSAGTITSGQGTPTITVDTTGLGGQNIKLTLEVGGLPESCAKVGSCEAGVKLPPLVPHPLDRYRSLKFSDEKARLDNFAIAIQQEPTLRGYILVYAGEGDRPELRRRAKRIRSYLTNRRGVDAGRFFFVYSGDRKYGPGGGYTELWVMPHEVKFPFPGEIIK